MAAHLVIILAEHADALILQRLTSEPGSSSSSSGSSSSSSGSSSSSNSDMSEQAQTLHMQGRDLR
jgi:hypothetical protein